MLLEEWNMDDALFYAREEEQEKWQAIVSEKDAELAEKDAKLTNKEAELERLRSEIASLKAKL